MHPKSTESNDLELVNYGNGWAWLRPEAQETTESRYTLTDLGRRALAHERLFGPWPTVAEVQAQARGRNAA